MTPKQKCEDWCNGEFAHKLTPQQFDQVYTAFMAGFVLATERCVNQQRGQECLQDVQRYIKELKSKLINENETA